MLALRLEPEPTCILSSGQAWKPLGPCCPDPLLPGSSAHLLLPILCFQPSYTEIIKYNPHLQEICKICLCLETKIHKTESSGSSLLQQAMHAQASRPEIAQESLSLPGRHSAYRALLSRVQAWLYEARTLQAFLRQSQALGQKRPRTLILAHGQLESDGGYLYAPDVPSSPDGTQIPVTILSLSSLSEWLLSLAQRRGWAQLGSPVTCP